MFEVVDTIIGSVQKIIYGEDTHSVEVPSEKLRYIRDNLIPVTPKELKYFQGASYDIFLPYLGLKFLDENPEAQQQLLQKMISSSTANEVMHTVVEYFNQYKGDTTPVEPTKLRQITERSPSLVREDAYREIANAKAEGYTPVLIAYAGLLALPAALDQMKVDERFLIIMPDNLGREGLPEGYEITKDSASSLKCKPISESSFYPTDRYGLVDNTVYKGDTMRAVDTYIRSHAGSNIDTKAFPLYNTRKQM